jgi:hypothetical protein
MKYSSYGDISDNHLLTNEKMKKSRVIYLFITLCLMMIIFSLKAQSDVSFPQDSAVWFTMYSYPWPDPPYIYYETYKYETKGDTVFNNQLYSKFYGSYVDESGNGTLNYTGAYRVENDNEKVYYLDAWLTEEQLVYDFKLMPGDTMISDGKFFICLDTGNIIMNDGNSYRFQTIIVPDADDCLQTWIRGIGSLGIPIFEPFWSCSYTFELSYNLTCFFYKNEHIYEWIDNPYIEGCFGSNVGIGEIRTDISLKVFPNPVRNHATISGITLIGGLFDYQIIDINGTVVQNVAGVQDVSIINNNFNDGIYLLRLFSHARNQFYTIKFIINQNLN